MQISKDSLLWAIISLLIGTVFGSGAIRQWQKNNLERERFEFEKVTKAIEIRKRMDDVYSSILQLSDDYIKVSNAYYKSNNSSAANEMRRLIARLDVLKSDYTAIENTLSVIEHRVPRTIQIDFIPPAPPANLRIQ